MRTLLCFVLGLVLASPCLLAQKDWASYGQDQGATRFSKLNQISASNVGKLKRA